MTFKLNREFFEFLVMYFGLYNLLVIFELIIDSMLWKFIKTENIIVYINNILIFTKTIEEHNNIVD